VTLHWLLEILSLGELNDASKSRVERGAGFWIDDRNELFDDSLDSLDELWTSRDVLGLVDIAEQKVTFIDVRHDLILPQV